MNTLRIVNIKSMKKKYTIAIFLVIPLSVLQVLILFELGLRVTGYKMENIPFSFISRSKVYQLDPDLLYRQRADINSPITGLFTNSLGLKIVLTGYSNFRIKNKQIVILGDSFVWGNTPNAETYPNHLQDLIHAKNFNYEVLNAGISGYGTDQEFLFFNKYILPKVKPAYVVWNINYNDVFDNIDRPLFDLKNNKLEKIPKWLNGLYLSAVISNQIPNNFKKNSFAVNWFLNNISRLKLFRVNGDTKIAWSVAKIIQEVKEMQKVAQKNKFRLIIAISPNKAIIDDFPEKSKETEVINQIKQGLRDVEIVDQNDFFIFFKHGVLTSKNRDNILGVSTNSELFLDERDQFPIDAWHPNSLGNYLMAKSIAEVITLGLK